MKTCGVTGPCLDAYMETLKRSKVGGMELLSMLERARDALESLKAGRHRLRGWGSRVLGP